MCAPALHVEHWLHSFTVQTFGPAAITMRFIFLPRKRSLPKHRLLQPPFISPCSNYYAYTPAVTCHGFGISSGSFFLHHLCKTQLHITSFIAVPWEFELSSLLPCLFPTCKLQCGDRTQQPNATWLFCDSIFGMQVQVVAKGRRWIKHAKQSTL